MHHFPEILKLKKVLISDKNVLLTKIVFVHPMRASLREIATCEYFFHEWRHWLSFEKGDEAACLGYPGKSDAQGQVGA